MSNCTLTTASTAVQIPFQENRFLHRLSLAIVVAIAVSAYRPESVYDWFLENALVFSFLSALAITYRRLSLSDLTYTLLLAFLVVHEWGAHYKYSDVPLGEWMKPWLATKRNDYDRVIHFSFGLLCAYPMHEVFRRSLKVPGRWQYYLPVECTLALSAFYELLEALMANILTPERGEEFVGMQGDIWDSQKDMFVATLGSIVCMAILLFVRWRRPAPPPVAQAEPEFVQVHR